MNGHWSIPEKAIELSRSAEADELDPDASIELSIVVAGARSDLGQIDAALAHLERIGLDKAEQHPRLAYAYADLLLKAGRGQEALSWFIRSADVDNDEETDALDTGRRAERFRESGRRRRFASLIRRDRLRSQLIWTPTTARLTISSRSDDDAVSESKQSSGVAADAEAILNWCRTSRRSEQREQSLEADVPTLTSPTSRRRPRSMLRRSIPSSHPGAKPTPPTAPTTKPTMPTTDSLQPRPRRSGQDDAPALLFSDDQQAGDR